MAEVSKRRNAFELQLFINEGNRNIFISGT